MFRKAIAALAASVPVACAADSDSDSVGDVTGTATGGTGASATGVGAGSSTNPAGGAGAAVGGSVMGGTGTSSETGGAFVATGGIAAETGGTGTGGAGSESPEGSVGCGVTDSPPNGTYAIDVDGLSREFNIKLPTTYDPSVPYRLVFAWHWLTGTAERVQGSGYYGLESLSAGTAIFVAGQGLDSNGDGEYGWPDTDGRDVAFARELLDWVRSRYCIDNARIFSTGWSYGGMFSNRLGCVMGDVLRAIAPMSGSGPRGGTCVGRVAAWISHGDRDATVSLASGEASRDYWATSNHCTAETVSTEPSPCVAYQGCDSGFPVHWCVFSGGHTQPSFGSDGIWNFFSQF